MADPSPERRARFDEIHRLGDDHLWGDPLRASRAAASRRGGNHRFPRPFPRSAHDCRTRPLAITSWPRNRLPPPWRVARGSSRAAEKSSGSLHIGHVLRFTPFFQTLHDVVRSGRLGDIVTVEHRENLVAYHMAHSFVRGNWGKREFAPPMIVAKCTHDLDILHWNLGSPVRTISSVGNLFEFRPERAPEGATERCTDPCPVVDCPYDARRVYLNPAFTGWPVHVITDDLSPEGRLRAIETGPYGICAYRAGSDVVDHQVVTMELESGTSVSLTMHGHSHEEGRTMRYDGTRATLRGRFGRVQEITVHQHSSGEVSEVPIPTLASGHGGGDAGILEGFIDSVENGTAPVTSGAESMISHYLAFMAEEARVRQTVISLR